MKPLGDLGLSIWIGRTLRQRCFHRFASIKGFGTPKQVFQLQCHAEVGAFAFLFHLLQGCWRNLQSFFVETSQLHKLIHGSTHKLAVFSGDEVEKVARRVRPILWGDFDWIGQLAPIELQGRVAVRNQQVWTKSALGLIRNFVNEVGLG